MLRHAQAIEKKYYPKSRWGKSTRFGKDNEDEKDASEESTKKEKKVKEVQPQTIEDLIGFESS